jgi:hypothetical protein
LKRTKSAARPEDVLSDFSLGFFITINNKYYNFFLKSELSIKCYMNLSIIMVSDLKIGYYATCETCFAIAVQQCMGRNPDNETKAWETKCLNTCAALSLLYFDTIYKNSHSFKWTLHSSHGVMEINTI